MIDECSSLDVSFVDDEALPPGLVFTDVQLKKWRIGKPIGRGSFGRIYLASDDVEKEVTKQNARYVVKIEPHTNGPLFVEVHCLIRTAQVSKVKAWRQQNKLKRIGMPIYIASGSIMDENTGTKYRFLVLPRNNLGKFGNFMGSARQFTWAEILAGNPEDIIRKERNPVTTDEDDDDDDTTCKYRIRKLSNASNESSNETNIQSPLMQKDYLQKLNPTYAMKEVLANFKKKLAGKVLKESEEVPVGLEGYTPAMIRLHKIKEKREAKEKQDAMKQSLENRDLVRQTRCTRSMATKIEKEKIPNTRRTRKNAVVELNEKTSDTSSNNSLAIPKSNDEITSRSTRSVTSKKEVKIKSPKKTTKPRTRNTTVVLNRRRLRSSKRKKQ
ncbi:unnamed protein product, partial [Iphiclides podalirius]